MPYLGAAAGAMAGAAEAPIGRDQSTSSSACWSAELSLRLLPGTSPLRRLLMLTDVDVHGVEGGGMSAQKNAGHSRRGSARK